jgi:hypothetical protein
MYLYTAPVLILCITFLSITVFIFFMDTQNAQTTLNGNNLQYLLYIDIHLVANSNHNLDNYHYYHHVYQQIIH